MTRSQNQNNPRPGASQNGASPTPGLAAPFQSTTPAGELAAWVRLNLTHGIGPATGLTLLRAFGTPPRIFEASHRDVSAVVGAALATRLLAEDDETDTAVELALGWAEQSHNHLLTLADSVYPPALLEIPDPPPLLYVKGNPSALKSPGIGIVGSRHATRAGLDNAAAFAGALAGCGLTINSGLARGVDAAAHQGALDAGHLTVAVMGTGIDRIYPAAHRGLAETIIGQGAIITEMPMGSAAMRGNFPRRNRLIAGLSAGVLVVEAARQSGSLITARQAAEFGREVFAIPGSIHSPVSRGCHQLIREGAKLVESADDVIAELQPLFDLPTVRAPVSTLSPVPGGSPGGGNHSDSHQQLLQRIGWDAVSLDALLTSDAEPADAALLAQALLELELSGQIERLPGARVQRRPGHPGK